MDRAFGLDNAGELARTPHRKDDTPMSYELRATRLDLMRVLEGHPMTLENNIRLRLYTAAELVVVVKASQDKIGMPEAERVPLSADQLAALTDG